MVPWWWLIVFFILGGMIGVISLAFFIGAREKQSVLIKNVKYKELNEPIKLKVYEGLTDIDD